MSTVAALRRTPFHQQHRHLGAKLIDFHGWELPIQYAGIIREHQAVRSQAGLFDVSHMGQVYVEGPGAGELLQKVNTNDIGSLKPGAGLYSHMTNPKGGIVDDVIVSCLAPERYLVVVNADTADKDFAWIKSHSKGIKAALRIERAAMIALQGPRAADIAERDFPDSRALPRFGCFETRVFGQPIIVTRTGYTGEDGFEFILPLDVATRLWQNLILLGRSFGLEPCGLGARDTLRLEAGYLLYGSDITDEHTPYEAGYGWVVKPDKGDFIGRDALIKQKKEGLKRWLTGVRLSDPGVPRPGAPVLVDGVPAGTLVSATFSPSLKTGIGMGYLDKKLAPGTKLAVEIHGRKAAAEVVKPPFYKKPKEKS